MYINRIASYLPNKPISNDEMEDYIGMIGGKPSRVRSIVLRQNGIKTRYYGLDKEHKITHSNAHLQKKLWWIYLQIELYQPMLPF